MLTINTPNSCPDPELDTKLYPILHSLWLNISKRWSCHSWWKVPFWSEWARELLKYTWIHLLSPNSWSYWTARTRPNQHDFPSLFFQSSWPLRETDTDQMWNISFQLDLTDEESDHLIIRKSIAMTLWVVDYEVENVILRISFLHFSCSTTQAHYFKWLSWFLWNGNGKVRSDTNEIIRWDKRYRWDRQVRLEIQVR